MHDGTVTDGDAFSYDAGETRVRMQTGQILNVGLVSNFDSLDVPSKYRPKQHGAVPSKMNFSPYRSGWSDEAIGPNDVFAMREIHNPEYALSDQ
jgi:hypothetical protein